MAPGQGCGGFTPQLSITQPASPSPWQGFHDAQLRGASHLGVGGTELDSRPQAPAVAQGNQVGEPEARSGPLALRKALHSRLDPGGGEGRAQCPSAQSTGQAQEWGGGGPGWLPRAGEGGLFP